MGAGFTNFNMSPQSNKKGKKNQIKASFLYRYILLGKKNKIICCQKKKVVFYENVLYVYIPQLFKFSQFFPNKNQSVLFHKTL